MRRSCLLHRLWAHPARSRPRPSRPRERRQPRRRALPNRCRRLQPPRCRAPRTVPRPCQRSHLSCRARPSNHHQARRVHRLRSRPPHSLYLFRPSSYPAGRRPRLEHLLFRPVSFLLLAQPDPDVPERRHWRSPAAQLLLGSRSLPAPRVRFLASQGQRRRRVVGRVDQVILDC